MITNLFTQILNFTIYIIIAHPFVIAYEIDEIVRLCVIRLCVVAVEVNHDDVGIFAIAILALKPGWLRLILLIFLFLFYCLNNLHLRIAIT